MRQPLGTVRPIVGAAPGRTRAAPRIARTAAFGPGRRSGRAGSASGGRRRRNARGTRASRPCSTSSGLRPGARPVRLATRKMCVSHRQWWARPKATLSTHVGRLAADAGQRLQGLAASGHLAAVLLHQDAAGLQQVARLGAEQADGADGLGDTIKAEFDHGLGRGGQRKQGACGLVDADVGGLR